MVRGSAYTVFIILTLMIVYPFAPMVELYESENSETSGRAQTTWSGSMVLNNHFTVPVTDELIISSCTNVTMSSGVRIYVCLLYTSPSPRDQRGSRMPSSA